MLLYCCHVLFCCLQALPLNLVSLELDESSSLAHDDVGQLGEVLTRLRFLRSLSMPSLEDGDMCQLACELRTKIGVDGGLRILKVSKAMDLESWILDHVFVVLNIPFLSLILIKVCSSSGLEKCFNLPVGHVCPPGQSGRA